MTEDLTRLTIACARDGLAAGRFSAVELTQAHLEAMARARGLNTFITETNAAGGIDGVLLPLVSETARFNDSFNSLDIRISRPFKAGTRIRIEPMVEVFNLFNVTNILGVSNVNYSGYSNVLVRDSDQAGTPGYLRSSRFGQPETTAGGEFGSGGPRAMQLAARVTF